MRKKLASVRYHLTERRVLNAPFESLPAVERREGLACWQESICWLLLGAMTARQYSYMHVQMQKDALSRHIPLRQEVPTTPRDSLASEPHHNYRQPKQFRLFFRSNCANKAAVCVVHQHPLHHVSAC